MSIDFSIDTEKRFTVSELLLGTRNCLHDLTLADDIPTLSLVRFVGGHPQACNNAETLNVGLYSVRMTQRTEEALVLISDADHEFDFPSSLSFEVAKTRTDVEFVLVSAAAIFYAEKAGAAITDHSGFWCGDCMVNPTVLRKQLTLVPPSRSLEVAASLIAERRHA